LLPAASAGLAQEAATLSPFLPVAPAGGVAPKTFEWKHAVVESYRLLLLEHGFRVAFQHRTRRELGGPFLKDYFQSVGGIGGWGDGDSWLTNYIGHPMQGAVAGYVGVQNSPAGRSAEFGRAQPYWSSRFKAMLWSAAYSTAFEIGPLSEASLGNVGQNPGTAGLVDHVMTPTGGLAMMVGEDAVDRFVIGTWEQRTRSDNVRRLLRVAFNPSRSIANLLRGKAPWHRDTRPLREP
jgi:hypothetical protein